MSVFIESSFIQNIFFSFILGIIICITYMFTNKETYSKDFTLTLLLLPIVISTIILTVGNNIAGAFSLAGIFSIVRFRSTPGNPRDITYILFTVGAGLLSSTQNYISGLFFIIFVCLITILITNFFYRSYSKIHLKILVPEDLNFENAFEEILQKYTKSYSLTSIQTRDLGSLYQLKYDAYIDKKINKKQMLDDLRIRNGNLNISLTRGDLMEN